MSDDVIRLRSRDTIRHDVEFANSVWCPFKLGDIKEIEKIQKRATKLIIKLKDKPYRDRLFHLNLPTLPFVILWTWVSCKKYTPYRENILYGYFIRYKFAKYDFRPLYLGNDDMTQPLL